MQQCARPRLQPLPLTPAGVDVSVVETMPWNLSPVAEAMKNDNKEEEKGVKDSEKDDKEPESASGVPPKEPFQDLFHAMEVVPRCEQMEERDRMLKERDAGKDKEDGFSPEPKKKRKKRNAQAKAKSKEKGEEKKNKAAKAKEKKAAAKAKALAEKKQAKEAAKAKALAEKKQAKEAAKAKALAEKKEKNETKRKNKAEARVDTEQKAKVKKPKATHPAEGHPTPSPDESPARASQGAAKGNVSEKKSFAPRNRPSGVAGDRWDGVKKVFLKNVRHRVGWVSTVEARLLKVSKIKV